MAGIITAEEFLERLTLKQLPEGEKIVKDELFINDDDIQWEFKKITNVTFKNKVHIIDAELKSGLHFEDCTFENGLYLKGLMCKKFNSNLYNNHYTVLNFLRCAFNSFLIINSALSRDVVLQECTVDHVLGIEELNLNQASFYCKKTEVKMVLDVINFKMSDLQISNGSKIKVLRLENSYGLSIKDSEFVKEVKVFKLNCGHGLSIENSKFNASFEIMDVNFLKTPENTNNLIA